MSWTIAACTPSDIPAIRAASDWAWPGEPTPEELGSLPFPVDPTRMRLVHGADGGAAVGVFGAYSFPQFPTPGGHVRAAGLTWVGVHPGYRRRGMLRSMIARHLADCAAEGAAISALTASEAAIYGRFGYGLAVRSLSLEIPRGAAMKPVPGIDDVDLELRYAEPADTTEMAELHLADSRPGWIARVTEAEHAGWLADVRRKPERERLRVAWASREGKRTGYALFARTNGWQDALPDGTVTLRELVATDPASRAALWRLVTDMDLMARCHTDLLPLDDPITHLLLDLRATKPRLADLLWVRLIDLAAALEARAYAADVEAVIEVRDRAVPANAGRWRISVSDGAAHVERTSEAAAIGLDIADLASAYLGDARLTALAASGLVEVLDTEALMALDQAFSWHRAPGTTWVF